jgi:MoaA/NifB/PqqE/SkfB family radical SAM enzyme/GT2 family glycosyltransferase
MKQTAFFIDERHAALADPVGDWTAPNIGADGRDLTITLLSLNRAALSIRLIESVAAQIPNFAGRILIGDNGSASEELQRLEEYCANTCRFPARILKFGSNHGVAGGRNRAFAEVETNWILSLDNDIYLVSNPLPAIQRDLAQLGCHFLSVPLLNPDRRTFYSFGGHLQALVENGRARLTIATVLPTGSPLEDARAASADGGFLCSFLFGGASVLNKATFQAAGAFDEGMLIGFEDIDFSLRLFRSGYKVGSSAVTAFVHDHPVAQISADQDYERLRFCRTTIEDSARYLERKHGYRIWGDEVESWLTQHEAQQNIAAAAPTPVDRPRTTKAPRRPRIALATDTDDWAFSNISRQLVRHLSDRYEFEVIPMTRLAEIEQARWLERGSTGFYAPGGASAIGHLLIKAKDFDLVHVFWREYLLLLHTPLLEAYAQFLGMTLAEFEHRFLDGACITTCVYDHLHQSPQAIAERKRIFNDVIAGYYVASQRLERIYRHISGLPQPLAVVEDGVDRTIFRPWNLERFDALAGRDIVVGWVGNSRWAAELGDFKGVRTILEPAIEELRAEGLPVRLHLADRQKGSIPHDEMPAYYAQLDLYICTSEIEGTPNPVLEAMACGVPVISTDVGVVPQVFGDKQHEFILAERSIACLKAAIRRLLSEPALFKELSAENLRSIAPWDWSRQIEKFAAFFDTVLTRRALATGEAESKMCTLPFTTPSIETDGNVRLCSAASIFNFRDETNMGNVDAAEGLAAVWRGEKYRRIRTSLFTGCDLTPYCKACEYRFSGPAWLLQLHMGLHAWHNGIEDKAVRELLARHSTRYAEYRRLAPSVGLSAYPPAEGIAPAASTARMGPIPIPEAIIDGAEMPIYVDLNTLNRCNVSCIMCPPAIKIDDLGAARDAYYRLTVERYEKLIAGLRVKSAHFVGAYAEPLLNKDIFRLVKKAHDQGAFTAITTNAMPLSAAFAARLIDAGLDMLSISLHGARQETAEAIMRKSRFQQVLANIRSLQALKRERNVQRPELHFNFVSQLRNVDEIPDFVDLAADLEVVHLHLIHLIDGDEAVNKQDNLIYHPHRLVPNIIEAERRARIRGINLYVSPAYQEILDAGRFRLADECFGGATATPAGAVGDRK